MKFWTKLDRTEPGRKQTEIGYDDQEGYREQELAGTQNTKIQLSKLNRILT
jgi:hypothetical protein